ncbi:hypothetical protein ACCO45_013672 [Purpureocillium lilacinum]|uniref:Uncharacterized protein n=1 Tax=Purpureocillium lilacinum TaxID=33203 RepID=A0ACC4D6Q1_PURLI
MAEDDQFRDAMQGSRAGGRAALIVGEGAGTHVHQAAWRPVQAAATGPNCGRTTPAAASHRAPEVWGPQPTVDLRHWGRWRVLRAPAGRPIEPTCTVLCRVRPSYVSVFRLARQAQTRKRQFCTCRLSRARLQSAAAAVFNSLVNAVSPQPVHPLATTVAGGAIDPSANPLSAARLSAPVARRNAPMFLHCTGPRGHPPPRDPLTACTAITTTTMAARRPSSPTVSDAPP